ncbi:hypothetical protein OG948_01235 [Embleya sp. NBC_00888]|uniref:hypothetical protein n=1 Tax=Embleya sp. NBC_00888 TaxID=2975960 RepID=UPI003867A6CD|nr:hypothetical protein OG948_01235 [Embleya sp. NBC_00888]
MDIPERRASSTDGPELTAETLAIVSTLAGLPLQEGIALALKTDGFTSAETGAILGVGNQRARDLRKQARRRLRWLRSQVTCVATRPGKDAQQSHGRDRDRA